MTFLALFKSFSTEYNCLTGMSVSPLDIPGNNEVIIKLGHSSLQPGKTSHHERGLN